MYSYKQPSCVGVGDDGGDLVGVIGPKPSLPPFGTIILSQALT
jgi:hypothetical protein